MIAQNWPVPAQSSPVQVVPAAIIDSQAEGEKAVHCHHNRTMSLDENTRLSSMDLGTGPQPGGGLYRQSLLCQNCCDLLAFGPEYREPTLLA